MSKVHFLQSDAWEKFQKSLGNKTIRREGDGWSYLAIVESGGGQTRLYCPYGPTVSSFEALDRALESLAVEARSQGATFCRVQPCGIDMGQDDTEKRSMRAIEYSQPVATRIIDLSPSLEKIIANVSQSKRSVVRNYRNKGMVYRISKNSDDVEKLLPLLHDIAGRNQISVHSDEYLRTQATSLLPDYASLHFIELDGKTISGALLFEDDNTCYYAHAGTATDYYKLQANTALVGEMISYAKKNDKLWFDLYGVAPDDKKDHPWAGLSEFKASFGGEIVHYNQTYDIPLKKMQYFVYEKLRLLKKLARL